MQIKFIFHFQGVISMMGNQFLENKIRINPQMITKNLVAIAL